MAKKFNHKKHCADHVKVEGYTSKVCILKGQDPEPVIRFAEVMYKIAKAFHIVVRKPAGKVKQDNSIHNLCEGHFEFPGMGKVCYGGPTRWTEQEARQFAKEIGKARANLPTEKWRRFWSYG